MKSRIRTVIGTAVIAGALLALPAPAMARSGDLIRTGTCSSGAHWKIKAGARDGGIEMEFQVDSNKVGQVWRVRVLDNSVLRVQVLKTTQAPSGSFTVHRTIRNMTGIDYIVARARNLKTDEFCVARIRI